MVVATPQRTERGALLGQRYHLITRDDRLDTIAADFAEGSKLMRGGSGSP
jgi:hypothetical protein